MRRAVIAIAAMYATWASASYVVEWSASLSYSMATGYTANKLASYDITGDSIPELFVMDSSALKVFNGVTHSLIWTIPLSYTYGGYPIICNTDGDANKELVFSAYSYSYPNYSGKFFVYDCQTHNQDYSSPVKGGYPSVSVADIDGDGKSEICCISGAAGSRILEVYGSDAGGVDEGKAPDAETRATGAAAPNPTRSFVQLNVGAPAKGEIVTVSDISGRVLRRIPAPDAQSPDGPSMPVLWDCRDDAGRLVPPGSYLFRCGAAYGRVEVVR